MSLNFITQIRRNFSARVIASLLLAMCLVTGTFTFFFLQSQYAYLEREIIKDGRLLTGLTANSVRLGIFAQDRHLLADALQNVINVEDVISACAYNDDGELLYQGSVPEKQSIAVCLPDGFMDQYFRDQLVDSSQVKYFEEDKRFAFWSPVTARPQPQKFVGDMLYFEDQPEIEPDTAHLIGFVGVMFDKGPIQQGIKTILKRYIFFLFFFLCVICLVAYYIVQGATKPLNRLIADIKKPDNPESDVKDDVGFLSDTFSKMVESLGESFETISSLKQGLELKVQELESEISTRRQIESELRENEEKFRNISEGIADGVAVIINDKFIWWNMAFRSIFSYQPAELHYVHAKELLPDLYGNENNINDRGKYPRYLAEARTKKNRSIFIEVHAKKVVFENRDAIQVIIRDVTELEEMEKKRKALEVKALGQSKLASLGKIATSVAHEINQPLSYIKISYESMLRDMDNNMFDQVEAKEYCTESLRQVGRITMITDHLRSFGRTDASKLSDVQIQDVLRNSLTLMGESVRLADITLVREIEENLPPVHGNSVKLEQVFINLFQNSVDAMKEGSEKKIFISMRRAGSMIETCFADSGPGVAPDILENIFEPFFTTKRLEDRSGLGLGIVNNIITEHKGTIEYSPREGWGASFVILLPAVK